MNPLTQSKNATILPVLIALTLGCFALSPQARAVCREGCDVSNFNTFLGDEALSLNTTGSSNTAIGFEALFSNTTGFKNAAYGDDALENNTSGNRNTAFGNNAGKNLTTGSNNIDIGDDVVGVAGESNKIRIGTVGTQNATFIAGISGVAVTAAR